MSEIPNRDDLEAQFAKRFGKLARKHMREFRELLGDPPDLANVPPEFWEKMQREIDAEMYAILLLIFDESALYHGWDAPEAGLAAYGWAKQRADQLSKYWVDSAQEKLQAGFATLERPSDHVDETIDDLLESVWGPKRVELTAVDETTRARHAGGESGVEATVGLSTDDLWRVQVNAEGKPDAKVCVICEPLNEVKREDWPWIYSEGPPAHNRCRCFIDHALVTPMEAIGRMLDDEDYKSLRFAKSYNPSEARDSDGEWTVGGAGPKAPAVAEHQRNIEAADDWKKNGVKSKAFKEWFGESKVTNDDGKPLVVYHGTNSQIDEFQLDRAGQSDDGYLGKGFYFGGQVWANAYAQGQNAQVHPVYLSIQKPLEIQPVFEKNARGRIEETDRSVVIRRKLGLAENASGEAVRIAAIKKGFDGVIYRAAADSDPADGGNEYVAFHPHQVKSSLGNRGTFDPNSSNIRKSLFNLKSWYRTIPQAAEWRAYCRENEIAVDDKSAFKSFNPSESRDDHGEWTDGSQPAKHPVIEAMRRLEPGADRGSLVGFRRLREEAGLPKEEFDKQILALSRSGKLSLHRHDYPAGQTQQQRDEMVSVPDKDGYQGRTYFVGAAIRQNRD